MSAMNLMTLMLSEAKETIHQRHIEEYYMLCCELIKEMVPQLIKQELSNIETDLWVKIQTQINGKNIDFPDIRNYIRQMIEDEIKNIAQEIRL